MEGRWWWTLDGEVAGMEEVTGRVEAMVKMCQYGLGKWQ